MQSLISFTPFAISGFYFLSCFLLIFAQIQSKKNLYPICSYLILVGATIHFFYFLFLFFFYVSEEKSFPFYHLLLFLSLVNILFYFRIIKRSVIYQYALVFPALSFMLIYLARFLGPREESFGKVSPIFELSVYGSRWIHITGIVVGILLFSISFVLSLFFLFQEKHMKQKKIDLSVETIGIELLIHSIYKTNFFGFIALNIALLFGMIAARVLPDNQSLWFMMIRYTIPMITWTFYGTLILNCSKVGLRGRFLSKASIIGFFLSISSLIIEMVLLKLSLV